MPELRLTRDELKKFLPSHQTIVAFENLLLQATVVTPQGLAQLQADFTAHVDSNEQHGAIGQVVGTANVQTLTNKTLIAPNLGTPTFANGVNFTNIPNGALVNDSITINGVEAELGDSITISATASNPLTIGTGLTGTSYDGSTPVTIALDIPVAIAHGGTGQTTKTDAFDALAPTTTAGDLIYHNGTDNVRLAAGSGVLVGGATPSYSTSPTLIGVNFSGIPNGALTNSSITINGNSVSLGGSTTVTATATNALTIGNGLTGTSYNGSAPVTIALSTPVAVADGGSGLSSIAQGDLLYGSSSNVITQLTKDTNATRYLANTGASNNPAWSQVDLSNGVTGNLPVVNGGTGQSSYTDGQILIGNSIGNTLTKATLTGTTNQINVTNGAGSITLATPQDINTTSTPRFGQMNLGPSQTQAMTTALSIAGTNSTTNNSAHFYTSTDQYPLLQILPFTHNNVSLNFDAYWDGTNWKSGFSSSNFQITKLTNRLNFNYAGVTAGSNLTWATALSINTSGVLNLSQLDASAILTTDASKNLQSQSSQLSYTPTIGDGTNNFTTSVAVGRYYKLGPVYFVLIQLTWTGKGSAVAGSTLRVSLPDTHTSSLQSAGSIGFNNGIGFTGNTLVASIVNNSSDIIFRGISTAAAQTTVTVSNALTAGSLVVSAMIWTQ